jgi:MFS family permease
MLLIEEDEDIARPPLTTSWKELIVSATVTTKTYIAKQIIFLPISLQVAAAWLFSLIAGPFCEHFGRKPTILLASVVFAVGSIVMGIASSKEVLLVGRIIVGQ